jgi:Ca-activated chloride channel family protein
MKRALSLKKPEHYARTIVIATDGYVTVEEEVFDLIRNNLGSANMFPFGIGSSVNRHIIEGMAHVGMGEPFVIMKPDEADAKAARFRAMIASPVLTQVKVDFNGFDAYDVEPLAVPDVLAERPVIVFGKWRGTAQGTITLKGISGDGNHTESIHVGRITPSQSNSALRYLWARHRITILSDYNKLRIDDRRIKEVTDLGLTYNLLTAYTSFVAVDSAVGNTEGKPTTIKQPLPMPHGVSDYAVGSAMQMSYAPSPMAMTARKEARAAREYETLKTFSKGQAHTDERKDSTQKFSVKGVSVSKGLSKDDVLRIVQAYLGEIEKCYAGKHLPKTLDVRLTITRDGTVKSVRVLAGAVRNDALMQCVIELVKKWQFSATKDGREVKAAVTLISGS